MLSYFTPSILTINNAGVAIMPLIIKTLGATRRGPRLSTIAIVPVLGTVKISEKTLN
jgi:hypothetical protein